MKLPFLRFVPLMVLGLALGYPVGAAITRRWERTQREADLNAELERRFQERQRAVYVATPWGLLPASDSRAQVTLRAMRDEAEAARRDGGR